MCEVYNMNKRILFMLFFTIAPMTVFCEKDPIVNPELKIAGKPTGLDTTNQDASQGVEKEQQVTRLEQVRKFFWNNSDRFVAALLGLIAYIFLRNTPKLAEDRNAKQGSSDSVEVTYAQLRNFNNSVKGVVRGNFENNVHLDDQSPVAQSLERAAHTYVDAAYKLYAEQKKVQQKSVAQNQLLASLIENFQDAEFLYERAFVTYAKSKGINVQSYPELEQLLTASSGFVGGR